MQKCIQIKPDIKCIFSATYQSNADNIWLWIKIALVAKQDKHCCKETPSNFISFLLWQDGVKPDLNYPVKFLMQCKLFPLTPLCSLHAKKDIIYEWIMNRWIMNHWIINHWIVYHELAQPHFLHKSCKEIWDDWYYTWS